MKVSGFVLLLRDARLSFEEAVKCAPDEIFRSETQSVLNRIEDLLDTAAHHSENAA